MGIDPGRGYRLWTPRGRARAVRSRHAHRTPANVELSNDLLDTWRIAARLNRYLLDALPADVLPLRAPDGKGRTVGEQIAHIHNVRLLWIRSAAPELTAGLAKVEAADAGDPVRIRAALEASGEAIATLLEQALAAGRVKGFKPHPAAFLGYLLAHEGHHRGQAVLTLRLAGRPLDKKVTYGLWEWGVR